MKLYDYFRSSAAYRVRIALNLKELPYQSIPVNLREGEQKQAKWLATNPQGFVPVLETSDGHQLTQSVAIIEWLEEQYPAPALIPGDGIMKAKIRALAAQVACDIHPVNNLRVLQYLKDRWNITEEDKKHWYQHWVKEGFAAIEQQMEGGGYCVGEQPTLADLCLIPQVYNALRFGVDMALFPRIHAVYEHCNSLDSFAEAAPQMQSDAV